MGLACQTHEELQGLTFLTPEAEVVVSDASGGRHFLDEACAAAREVYGDAFVGATVSLSYDPDGSDSSPCLDLRLRAKGARQELRRMLKQFDRSWWLDAYAHAPFSIPMQVTQEPA